MLRLTEGLVVANEQPNLGNGFEKPLPGGHVEDTIPDSLGRAVLCPHGLDLCFGHPVGLPLLHAAHRIR